MPNCSSGRFIFNVVNTIDNIFKNQYNSYMKIGVVERWSGGVLE